MNIEAEADKWMRNEIIRFLIGIVGVAIYCFGVNYFMVPVQRRFFGYQPAYKNISCFRTWS